jgi:hypothetical protein
MPNLVEFEEKSRSTEGGGDDDTMKNPAAEVNRLSVKLIQEEKAKDYHEAGEIIAKDKPKLWKAYIAGESTYEEEDE